MRNRPVLFITYAVLSICLTAQAGCASKISAPATVNKPVILPCQTDVPARPVFAADNLTEDDDIFTKGMALWADRKAREAYELAVRTRLEGCVKP